MAKTGIGPQAMALTQALVAELGYELLEVNYEKEGAQWYLRFIIDRKGGISLEDCEVVSRAVDPVVDEQLSIPAAYYLEVQSPGLDRPLKTQADFLRYQGERVDISLYQAHNGQKKLEGILVAADESALRLGLTSSKNEIVEELLLPFEQLALVKRHIDF